MLRFLSHALLATLSLAAAPFAPFFRWLARAQERDLERLTALREQLDRNERERVQRETEQILRPAARQPEQGPSRSAEWQAARDAMTRRNDELRREREARETRDQSQADPGRTRQPPRYG